MSNGEIKPRMNYGNLLSEEFARAGDKGPPMLPILTERVIGMMKADPYFKLEDSYRWDEMQSQAEHYLTINRQAAPGSTSGVFLKAKRQDTAYTSNPKHYDDITAAEKAKEKEELAKLAASETGAEEEAEALEDNPAFEALSEKNQLAVALELANHPEANELEREQILNAYVEQDMREREGVPEPTAAIKAAKKPSAQPSAARLRALTEEQGNWVTLKTGKKVFIKKK